MFHFRPASSYFLGSSHLDPLRTCFASGVRSPSFPFNDPLRGLMITRVFKYVLNGMTLQVPISYYITSGTKITCGTSFMEETPSHGLWQVVSQFVRGRKPRQRAWKSAEAPIGKPCFWMCLGPIALHIVTLLKLGSFRHPPCAGSTCSVYIYMCVFFYWYRGTIYRYGKIW